MISIKQDIVDSIIMHARKELPYEACGYLAGNEGTVTIGFQITNADHSSEHFSFDPSEQFRAVKDARNKGLKIMANYHSHPQTPARPSKEDIRLAYDPGISYIIISLAESTPVLKSFKIRNEKVENEEIKIIK